jgi:hypothetical protein
VLQPIRGQVSVNVRIIRDCRKIKHETKSQNYPGQSRS